MCSKLAAPSVGDAAVRSSGNPDSWRGKLKAGLNPRGAGSLYPSLFVRRTFTTATKGIATAATCWRLECVIDLTIIFDSVWQLQIGEKILASAHGRSKSCARGCCLLFFFDYFWFFVCENRGCLCGIVFGWFRDVCLWFWMCFYNVIRINGFCDFFMSWSFSWYVWFLVFSVLSGIFNRMNVVFY